MPEIELLSGSVIGAQQFLREAVNRVVIRARFRFAVAVPERRVRAEPHKNVVEIASLQHTVDQAGVAARVELDHVGAPRQDLIRDLHQRVRIGKLIAGCDRVRSDDIVVLRDLPPQCVMLRFTGRTGGQRQDVQNHRRRNEERKRSVLFQRDQPFFCAAAVLNEPAPIGNAAVYSVPSA